MAVGTVLIVVLVWVVLFVYHLVRAGKYDRRVISERKSFANVKGDFSY
jgi:hypothetical protein